MSEFGTMLRTYREFIRLSQSRLAARADLDHSYVSRLESGQRTPTREAVTRISDALRLDAEQHDILMRAAGFINNDDAAFLTRLKDDAEVAGLVALFNDPDVPAPYQRMTREIVAALIDQAMEAA